MSKEALKSIQAQVEDEYNHETVAWNEPHPRIPVVLKMYSILISIMRYIL